MWYRSKATGKVIHGSVARVIDNIWGKETFNRLGDEGAFDRFEPTVIDVLRDTGSTRLAVIRYRELHKCSAKEAKRMVDLLRGDMARKGYKFKKKSKKREKSV